MNLTSPASNSFDGLVSGGARSRRGEPCRGILSHSDQLPVTIYDSAPPAEMLASKFIERLKSPRQYRPRSLCGSVQQRFIVSRSEDSATKR